METDLNTGYRRYKTVNKKGLIRLLAAAVCGIMMMGMTVTAFAADNTDNKDNSKKDEIDYTLDKQVKAWLDDGKSIPSEAKYASLGNSDHLWEIDDTDISDGKVELIANDEKRVLAGIALRDWLKTQSFYGEKLGDPDNKIEFIRPGKKKAF